MILETISKAIRLNLKQGKIIKCIHITKEDLEQIKQEDIFIQPEVIHLEVDKTTLFGYTLKEDFMTFIELIDKEV